jgi:hypothetical protein
MSTNYLSRAPMTIPEALKLLRDAGFNPAYFGEHDALDGELQIREQRFSLYEVTEHGETHLFGLNLDERHGGMAAECIVLVLDMLSEHEDGYGGGDGGWWDTTEDEEA